MALIEYLTFLFSVIIFLSFLFYFCKPQNLSLRNWHVFGMIRTLLANIHQFHDFQTKMLIRHGGTFMLKGPWFASMDMLVTAEPLDIHHILSKNFSNYPKGEEFRKMFDIFGDGILNVDGDLWKVHRKTTLSLFRHPEFQSLLETTVWNKIEIGLLPVLESISKPGVEIDLQSIFQRLTFDTMCKLLFDNDLQSLSLDFPCIPCEKVMTDMEVGIFYRHLFPTIVWKVQKLLGMQTEKKLSDGRKAMDQFIHECLARKLRDSSDDNETKTFGILSSLMRESNDQKYLRDSLFTLLGAGKETTSVALSWFFYLLAKNPLAENKLREEIYANLEAN